MATLLLVAFCSSGCSEPVETSTGQMESQQDSPALSMADSQPDAAREEEGFTGRCLCGAVHYRVTGQERKCNYCDCKGCRRVSGAERVGWVVVPRSSLKVTGQTKRVRGDAKEYPKCDAHGVRMFCPDCGTHLFWQGDRGDTVDIVAGSLDDSSIFQPDLNQ
jgi:hypothetical protein